MDKFILSMVVGLIVAVADTVPMTIKKLPRHTTIAAFIHYFFATVVIMNIDVPGLPWWLEGGVVGLCLMLPMLVHVAHQSMKPVPVIVANAVIFGTLAGVARHFLM